MNSSCSSLILFTTVHPRSNFFCLPFFSSLIYSTLHWSPLLWSNLISSPLLSSRLVSSPFWYSIYQWSTLHFHAFYTRCGLLPSSIATLCYTVLCCAVYHTCISVRPSNYPSIGRSVGTHIHPRLSRSIPFYYDVVWCGLVDTKTKHLQSSRVESSRVESYDKLRRISISNYVTCAID